MKHKMPKKLKGATLNKARTMPSYKGGNMGFNANTEISSFAADIGKLDKQNVDSAKSNF